MKKTVFSIFLFLSFMFFIGQARADEDIFQVKTPNVMIIFDTSSSMEMSVTVDVKGNSVWTNKYGPDKVTQYRKDGNHPDSKLYQAKKALSEVIDQVVKDKVNLGFSTYAQEKIEKWRGRYKRDVTTTISEAWRRYKRYYIWEKINDSTRTATSIYPDSFIASIGSWSYTVNNVVADPKNGTTFDRAIWIHDVNGPLHPQLCSSGVDCVNGFKALKPYTITYRVTARTYNPETNVYTFTYTPISPSYDRYREAWSYDIFTTDETNWITSLIDCGSDTKGNYFPEKAPPPNGPWRTHFSDDSPPIEYNTPSNGRTAGWWSCKVMHRDPATSTQTEYMWDNTTGFSCDATKSGTPMWELIPGTCFDWSGYKYTPEGTTNRPHTWSYFKKDSNNYWKKNQQPDPFYPALQGAPGENNNHHFFINFPDDKDPLFKESDRITIKNKIMSFLDLTPVKRPDASEYWTKLPVHAIEGKQGLTSNMDPLSPFAYNTQRVTPLADSLAWAYTYFYDYIFKYNGGDPSSKEKFGETLCRGNYIILLTDGLESCRFNGDVPDYNAAPQEAANLLSINVKTFVIGFGNDIKGNQNLNNIAIAGGTGKAYFATNLNELKEAMQTIFQAITGQYYGRSNPVITKARDRLFRGNFEIKEGDWIGHLMAWDADPKTGVLAPEFAWDAGEVMKTYGRGKVYTWTDSGLNPTLKEFKPSESSLYTPTNYVNPSNEDIDGNGITDDFVDEQTIINFTLDPNYNDGINGAGYYKGKRAIDWKLGDIYHSTPVVIAEPSFFFTENDYAGFYNANKNREVIIYVGANDGMLHAFKNTDGGEKFAIIPKNLLGKLKDLRITHNFYVDSSPKAYDVYFKNESKWKTVLISGQRGGGPYYFALDVTKPDDPKALWELTHTNMGETWAKPDIGKVKVNGETKFVAFLTGGYSTLDNKGNSFYIVDIESGTILKNFIVGNSTNKIPSGPTAYDSNLDGFVDYVYFGDIQGTLWKVDVRNNDPSQWVLYEFFKPVDPKLKPIFYSPSVVKNDEGKTLIFFGTGDEL
ncbi:MAG: pilus assembly protein, partial [Thermodesulfobacteriota bacterium]